MDLPVYSRITNVSPVNYVSKGPASLVAMKVTKEGDLGSTYNLVQNLRKTTVSRKPSWLMLGMYVMSWQSDTISMEHRFEFPEQPVDLETAIAMGLPLALLASPSPPGLPCGSSMNKIVLMLAERQQPITITQRGIP